MKNRLKYFTIFFSGLSIGYSINNYNQINDLISSFTNYPNYHNQNNKVLRHIHDSLPSLNVCFSPNSNCEKKIINKIDHAQSQILVQTYSFTSLGITQALIRAHQRGIMVKLLYDRSQINQKRSQIRDLIKAGIFAQVDYVQGIAHNKVMIIDHHIVLTGSYNFTQAANLRNAENLLIIDNISVAKIYEKNWYNRYDNSCNNIQSIHIDSNSSIVK